MYTLTKYYTNECSSCRALTAILESISGEVVELRGVNCADVPEAFLSKTGILGVPTVVLSDPQGKEINRFHGPKSKQQIIEWLQENKVNV